MSSILDSFEDLLDAQEEFTGERFVATVGAVTNKDAIVSEIPNDNSPGAGGDFEAGVLTLQMRKSDFGSPPAQGQAVSARGKTLKVASFSENNGIYIVTASDPTSEVE